MTDLQSIPDITIPDTIMTAMSNGAHLVLSCSGGKDSDVMTIALLDAYNRLGWSGDVVMVHADLGRMERSETESYVKRFADRHAIELVVVQHPKYDLLGGIEARLNRLEKQGKDAPPFPSSQSRYCTSDFKRGPISKFIRNRWVSDATVICAMGLRAEESHARAKKPVVKDRRDCMAHTKNRTVYDWNPILNWSEEDVWGVLGYTMTEVNDTRQHCKMLTDLNLNPYAYLYNTGWNAHPAYALGNERVSCGMCVLGCKSDVKNGAYDRPDTYRDLVDLEIKSGYTFIKDRPLYQVAPDLLRTDQRQELLS